MSQNLVIFLTEREIDLTRTIKKDARRHGLYWKIYACVLLKRDSKQANHREASVYRFAHWALIAVRYSREAGTARVCNDFRKSRAENFTWSTLYSSFASSFEEEEEEEEKEEERSDVDSLLKKPSRKRGRFIRIYETRDNLSRRSVFPRLFPLLFQLERKTIIQFTLKKKESSTNLTKERTSSPFPRFSINPIIL